MIVWFGRGSEKKAAMEKHLMHICWHSSKYEQELCMETSSMSRERASRHSISLRISYLISGKITEILIFSLAKHMTSVQGSSPFGTPVRPVISS